MRQTDLGQTTQMKMWVVCIEPDGDLHEKQNTFVVGPSPRTKFVQNPGVTSGN